MKLGRANDEVIFKLSFECYDGQSLIFLSMAWRKGGFSNALQSVLKVFFSFILSFFFYFGTRSTFIEKILSSSRFVGLKLKIKVFYDHLDQERLKVLIEHLQLYLIAVFKITSDYFKTKIFYFKIKNKNFLGSPEKLPPQNFHLFMILIKIVRQAFYVPNKVKVRLG